MTPSNINSEYSILITQSDIKLTGKKYPQINKCSENSKIWIKNMIKCKCNLPIMFTDNIFYLEETAILTDILSDPYLPFNNGLIVNEKVKDILSKFNLCEHYYYKIKISHNDTLYENYYVLQLISKLNDKKIIEYIDVRQSSFYIGLPPNTKFETISFNNLNEIEEKRKSLLEDVSITKMVCRDFLTFSKQELNNLDLFTISFLDINIYISNRLRDNMMINMITGIDILLTNKIQLL